MIWYQLRILVLHVSKKEIKKIKNLIIIGILLFFEIDTHFYQETYDPLFLICVFLLFDIKIVKNFFIEADFPFQDTYIIPIN